MQKTYVGKLTALKGDDHRSMGEILLRIKSLQEQVEGCYPKVPNQGVSKQL